MKVSVLIAAFDAEGHLERAVQSALEQSLPPHEVIIVDDASADGTLALAQRLAAQHPQVRALALPTNGGPAVARNAALAAATGDWVAILDADDTMVPGRLEAMLLLAESERADVVVDNFVFVREDSGARRASRIPAGPGWEPVDRYRFLRSARAFNYEPTWTLLQPVLRRSFVEQHGIRYPEHSRHGEDFLFMMDLLLQGATLLRLRAAGYLYTERAGGLSTTRADYSGLVDQSRRLLDDPRVSIDGRASRLLRRRIATLRCLDAQRKGTGALIRAALTSPGVAATVARRVGRRLSGSSKRSAAAPIVLLPGPP